MTLLDGNDDDFIDQKLFEEVKGTTLTYELDGKKLSPKGNYLLEVYFEGIVNGKCSGAYRLFKVNGNQDGSITPAPVQNPPNTGGTLPKTATSSLTYAWIGLVLIALGVVALRWKRSHS